MENIYSISLMVCLFLLGGLLSFLVLPAEVVETIKIETVEVPTVCDPCICEEVICEDVICEDIETEQSLLDLSIEEFLNEVEDDDDLLTCDGHEYDFDEVSVSKVYDSYTISYGDEESTIDFKIKLKYDEDEEKSCKRTFEPSVHFEDDEDTEVTV